MTTKWQPALSKFGKNKKYYYNIRKWGLINFLFFPFLFVAIPLFRFVSQIVLEVLEERTPISFVLFFHGINCDWSRIPHSDSTSATWLGFFFSFFSFSTWDDFVKAEINPPAQIRVHSEMLTEITLQPSLAPPSSRRLLARQEYFLSARLWLMLFLKMRIVPQCSSIFHICCTGVRKGHQDLIVCV